MWKTQVNKASNIDDKLTHLTAAWDGDVALSLLRSVPFRLSNQTQLHFKSNMQAVQVLGGASLHIPQTVLDWTARMRREDVRLRKKAMSRLTWDGAQYKLNYIWRTEQGEEIWIEEQGRRTSGLDEKVTEVKGVFTNVTAQMREKNRISFLSTHDDLTKIFNLKTLTTALDHLAALTRRQGGEGAFIRLRLSNLRDINSIYGYETGDRLIAEFARRLAQIIREPDVLGRIGGADFGIALYGSTLDDVHKITSRLFYLLENSPVKTPHGGLYGEFTASATQMRTQANSAFEALSQTETALKISKPSGLNPYTESMGLNAPNVGVETTADDILEALNQRRVRLAFQPIIETKSRKLHHYECLLRLRRKDGEIISAGRFIMAAERLGLVNLLDRRALELAAETLRQDPDLKLALNVSAGTVKDERAASNYLAALKALGPAANRVTLELTETVALDDPAMASEFSNNVRALGCGFAIDDFGSGYTTFRNLMAIEADTIKIDGTLIEGIASDPNKQTFVRMMVDLAQTFSVQTVAEMVDDRADAEILRRLGVDYLQGFMFGVPSAAPSWQKRAS